MSRQELPCAEDLDHEEVSLQRGSIVVTLARRQMRIAARQTHGEMKRTSDSKSCNIAGKA
jgi:hypothetical protein